MSSPSRSSSRFQRLLRQLNECHEEELNRGMAAWGVGHKELICPKCSSALPVSAKLPNAVFETPKDDWGTRVPRDLETAATCLYVEEVPSPKSSAVPMVIRSEVGPAPLKLRGDLDESGRDSDSEVGDEVSPIRRLALPDDEPRGRLGPTGQDRFPLRRLWASESKVQTVRLTRRATSKSKSLDGDDLSSLARGQDSDGNLPTSDSAGINWRRALISYPSSLHRLAWDMIGGMLIMYDLFAVPLQAFNPPETPALLAMDWITLVFWTVNVGASLTTGYVQEGNTIMDPHLIAKRYLKTWCIVDFVVLGPDWVFTIIATDSTNEAMADLSKMPRIVRLARVVRLLRLVRLKRLFEQIEDALDSEYYSVLFNIFKMMLLLFTVNHVIACGWYALADAYRLEPGANTWMETWNMEHYDWVHLYLVSLHWSLTQFTPAGMDVTPTNPVERGFTIGVVVFALVGFAYVVGSITASLAQLRTMSEEASKDFWQMRRFLNQNCVDHTLAARIQRFVEYAYTRQQKTMSVNQVKVLSLLSKQLMEELQCAINLPHMKVHPLFMFLNEFSFITMNRLAKESVSHMEMAQSDTLFLPEQHANCMYFVSFGRLEYVRVLQTGEHKEFVDKGEDWLAEPALWTDNWYHVGEAKAHTDCEVLLIDPKAFEEILNVVKPVAAIVATYCRRFMAWLETLETQEGMLTDVIQGDQVSDSIQSFLPMWMVEVPEDSPANLEHDASKRPWRARFKRSFSSSLGLSFWRR